MQHSLLAVDHQRVAGIVPALESRHGVRTLGEQVHDLALAFIAPLRADYDDVFTQSSTPQSFGYYCASLLSIILDTGLAPGLYSKATSAFSQPGSGRLYYPLPALLNQLPVATECARRG